ncbi:MULTISPECIES: fumarylacetoacetate hydrolase family protein [Deefgea]|uniref:Isomerase/hydrolase n=1 Tax=Deefgea chitinilytica TaxID=570276 RepID=A0ABS2CDS9_9NEIS|nr:MULTISPECIES: fumarylacetoacetate hydrolase family protein [Deefgea]MBM5572294.1 isomerase/hydrolase [Deefgea chitinilytica]MBM9889530.1 fumarylacetoacetate hydrolase family protein [Deefgea sp. CFH1-16]
MSELQIADKTLRINNIFCVARNFVAHAAEMGSVIASEPVVFIKPNSAVLQSGVPIVLPTWSDNVHHELELVVAIGEGGKHIAVADALRHVAGYALGLDLTARDVQAAAKKTGSPWTLAKGFDGAAVLTQFVAAAGIDPTQQQFTLHINGELRQLADTRLMAFDVATLIAWISSKFTLQPGDLIYTGTPEGVGQIQRGDELLLTWPGQIETTFVVL